MSFQLSTCFSCFHGFVSDGACPALASGSSGSMLLPVSRASFGKPCPRQKAAGLLEVLDLPSLHVRCPFSI